MATIDVSTPGPLRAFPYDIGLWLRMDGSGDGAFEVSFNHEWLGAGAYLDILRRQIAAATLPSQRKRTEASLEAILLLSATHSRRLLNAAEIFSQPRCEWTAGRCV